MIEFEFKEQKEGVWFSYQKSRIDSENDEIIWEDPIEGAEFLIRYIASFIEEKLKKEDQQRSIKFVHNDKTGKMERISFIPEKTFEQNIKETEEMYVWAICDWKGIGEKGKSEMVVSDENKIKLSKLPEFIRFFNKCQETFRIELESHRKEIEKN